MKTERTWNAAVFKAAVEIVQRDTGITAQEIQARLGISKTQFYRWTVGQSVPSGWKFDSLIFGLEKLLQGIPARYTRSYRDPGICGQHCDENICCYGRSEMPARDAREIRQGLQ
jgi:hypothetical protein